MKRFQLVPALAVLTVTCQPVFADDTSTRNMLSALSQAKSSAAAHPGNGALILSSALCSLWQTYTAPEQRQILATQAQSLANQHPGNGSLILAAGYGRCR